MSTITKINSYQRNVQQLRVAAYCRVSTDNIAQLESLENQLQHYQEYINCHPNWQLVRIYFDEGISGTKLHQRNALNKLLSDCRNHRIDLVITKSISRLSRNTTDCSRIVRELQQLNIPIYFEKERINTGEMASELFLLAVLPRMNHTRLQVTYAGPFKSVLRMAVSKFLQHHTATLFRMVT